MKAALLQEPHSYHCPIKKGGDFDDIILAFD